MDCIVACGLESAANRLTYLSQWLKSKLDSDLKDLLTIESLNQILSCEISSKL